MYEFAYCFSINNEVKWSSENTNSLINRVNQNEIEKVSEFIETSKLGDFIPLDDGALIFRCAVDGNIGQ